MGVINDSWWISVGIGIVLSAASLMLPEHWKKKFGKVLLVIGLGFIAIGLVGVFHGHKGNPLTVDTKLPPQAPITGPLPSPPPKIAEPSRIEKPQAETRNSPTVGNINQGACSSLQIGGEGNQQNQNCTIENPSPVVSYRLESSDINSSTLRVTFNKDFPAAKFVVVCEQPCEGDSASVDYGGNHPGIVVGPEVVWGRIGEETQEQYRRRVAFEVKFPGVLEAYMAVIAKVKSIDGRPVTVEGVKTLVITGKH